VIRHYQQSSIFDVQPLYVMLGVADLPIIGGFALHSLMRSTTRATEANNRIFRKRIGDTGLEYGNAQCASISVVRYEMHGNTKLEQGFFAFA